MGCHEEFTGGGVVESWEGGVVILFDPVSLDDGTCHPGEDEGVEGDVEEDPWPERWGCF